MTATFEPMETARRATLRLAEGLTDEELCAWPDTEFSPVGWHLGHIAFTEAQWAVGRLGGDPSLHAPHARAFAQDGRPKRERGDLPCREELLGYLRQVRERTREVARAPATTDPLLQDGFVWWFLAAHELQHRETMAFVLTQRRAAAGAHDPPGHMPHLEEEPGEPPMVEVPGGEATLGTDAPLAYDNERRAHTVRVASFRLDAHSVTCGAWLWFMRSGGYEDRSLWSDEGWEWLGRSRVRAPFGWVAAADGGWVRGRLGGMAPVHPREPVMGVSHHEAEAFARFRGARLPTETEWEHACRTFPPDPQPVLDLEHDGPVPVRAEPGRPTGLLGQVWEWTGSWFEPYPGFAPFPYRGYSTPYFDATHRVLRGGSFATHPLVARPSFRNWYLPHIRQIFSGLRCARDH